MRLIIGFLFLAISVMPSSAEVVEKNTSKDLHKVVAEPKVPELPGENEIIKEVLKTQVVEDEIEPIFQDDDFEDLFDMESEIIVDDPATITVSYLDELNAAFNTKDIENIKSFINLTDFFVIDWNQNIISTESDLDKSWQQLSQIPGIDNWRNSVKLNFIKPISPSVAIISTDINVSEGEQIMFAGTATVTVEYFEGAWKVKGVHLSQKIMDISESQNISLNMINYLILIFGILIGAVIGRISMRKKSES